MPPSPPLRSFLSVVFGAQNLSEATRQRLGQSLMSATKKRDLPKMRRLIAQGARGEIQPDGSGGPLSFAVSSGDAEAIALLLPVSDANETDARGTTPLMLAAAAGFHGPIKTLLAHGADPSRRDSHHNTALLIAANRGHAPSVRALLPVSDPFAVNRGGIDALMLATASAAKQGTPRALALLISACDGTRRDPTGATALMRAAGRGNVAAARLLAPVSDILAQNDHGLSVADFARSACSPDLAAELLAIHERKALVGAIGEASGAPAGAARPPVRRV
jgi:uncharacterized protein